MAKTKEDFPRWYYHPETNEAKLCYNKSDVPAKWTPFQKPPKGGNSLDL